jgi:hypothetical protein
MTDIPNSLFQTFGPAAGYTFPLACPSVDPDADPLIYVRMNRDWLAYVIAACMPLTLLETWRETDAATLSLAVARANLLIDMLMTLLCDPVCVGALRLAGNTLQYSPDGGASWENIGNAGGSGNPQDPRTSEPLLPVRSGANKRCLAAANATAVFVELHREVVAWYDANAVVAVLVVAIAGVLMTIFPVSWALFSLTLGAAELTSLLLIYTGVLNNAAFTTGIQDALTCIFYQYADSEGRWSQADFDAIVVEVGAQSGDMWALIGLYLSQIGGYAGLNNAGTTTSIADYDCGACAGYCYEFDFRIDDYGWSAVPYYGTCVYVPGVGFVAGSAQYNSVIAVAAFTPENPVSGLVTAWVTMQGSGNRSGAQSAGVICWNDPAGSQGYNQELDGETPGPWTLVITGISATMTTINIRAQFGGPGDDPQPGTVALQTLRLYSSVAIPDFAGNECS